MNSHDEEKLPATVNEAVDWIIRHMPDRDIARVRKMSSKDLMFDFHFSAGLAIRNGLGLHGENKALIADCNRAMYGYSGGEREFLLYHADVFSTFLLEKVWEKLHTENPGTNPHSRADSGT